MLIVLMAFIVGMAMIITGAALLGSISRFWYFTLVGAGTAIIVLTLIGSLIAGFIDSRRRKNKNKTNKI